MADTKKEENNNFNQEIKDLFIYYFFRDEVEARANSQEVWKREWRCNIGRTKTKEPVEGRILKETKYTAETVIIELLFRTDKDKYGQRAIHTIFKRHNKHIPPEQMNGEKEWFLTNPDEVKRIYEALLNPFDQ